MCGLVFAFFPPLISQCSFGSCAALHERRMDMCRLGLERTLQLVDVLDAFMVKAPVSAVREKQSLYRAAQQFVERRRSTQANANRGLATSTTAGRGGSHFTSRINSLQFL